MSNSAMSRRVTAEVSISSRMSVRFAASRSFRRFRAVRCRSWEMHRYQEGVVHILNDAVDGAGQLPSLIESTQMPEMPPVLVAGQRVLDVLADGGVDIAPGGLIIPEGGVLRVYLGIVEVQLPGPEGPAIADVIVNAVDSQQTAVLPIGNECGMNRLGPVIETRNRGNPSPTGRSSFPGLRRCRRTERRNQ